jgi:hypothetical protein
MKTTLSITLILVCLVAAAAQRPTVLYGRITNRDNSPARGVVVGLGNLNVTTDNDGNYRLTFVRPGTNVVSLTPSAKATRSFRVEVASTPTQKDFRIDW